MNELLNSPAFRTIIGMGAVFALLALVCSLGAVVSSLGKTQIGGDSLS